MSIPLLAGMSLWIIGIIFIVLSAQQISAANPSRKISQFGGRKHNFPMRARVVRGVAYYFLIVAAFTFSGTWGYYSVLMIALGFLPDLYMAARHNRAVDSAVA